MQLHNHSNYSVIDGRGLIDDYITLAEEDGQEAFALTDHGTMGGVIDFYTKAKKHATVKPIIGMEIYVDAHELRERPYPGHLTVLAKNEAGYRALIAANNLGARQFYYRPRITLQQIIDNNFAENWIILSGCMSSPIHFWPYEEAENMVRQLSAHSGGFFLEAMWHWGPNEDYNAKQDLYLNRVADLYRATQLPIVLTNDCHFAHEHNERIHSELMSRARDDSRTDLEFDGEGFHFKTTAQMQSIANDLGIPNAVDTAVSIGRMCDLIIPEADHVNWYVPDITGGAPKAKMIQICEAVLAMKNLGQEYWDRYHHELDVLSTSASILNSYLVAHDVITWCAERNIPAAARGSMAGSLISHLMGITTEDPIKYRLSFSRAVNPARPTIPDFDLDVSSIHRGEILDYLKQRYADNIPICAYTHYGPKGALRKILRMEGMRDPMSINEMVKPLPDDWADGDFEYSPSAKKYVGTKEWTELVPEKYKDGMAIYKGMYSTMSVHPSGLLIGGPERPVEEEVPLQWIASSKMLTSAFDMYTLKKVGLFKLDVLGLRTLDNLSAMERASGARVPNDDYDDPETLRAFGADLLCEVFQMDGYACRNVLRDIRGIETFEDIIAANTLARPGCAQFTQFYRSGYENLIREYPPLEEVLGVTNGLILYQEQVMEIARILADFDDAEQDDVKESIKYFRHDNWRQTIEPKFRERCEVKGFNPDNILEAISRMASYTYNRAHAMTYAALAYKMMWYKVHHPAAYYAAVFDAAADKSRLVLESHFFGVKWSTPDINRSQSYTTVEANEILLGLSSIKGLGPAAFEAIAETRPYEDLDDFMNRVNRRKCNIKAITILKNVYALESIGESGIPTAFKEAFGFPNTFLDSAKGLELAAWQEEDPAFRFGGFLLEVRGVAIQKTGQNQGKEMGRAIGVNIKKGSKRLVLFPDVWKKAKPYLYAGLPMKFIGEHQLSGEFIVQHGEEA